MGIGITEPLAFAAVCIWILGFALTYRELGIPLAMLVTTIKVGITLVYFSYLFTGDLLMKDDQVYHEYSVQMFDRGWGPLRMITEPEGMKEVAILVGSGHFLYYWWNLLAFCIFGKFYYAPVFLNVGLTFASAIVLAKLVRMAGFSRNYVRCFTVFFLLHWDLITWSSFVNLKDMIVLFLTISSMYCIARLGQKLSLRYIMLLGFIFFLFSMLRFYLPVLILMGGAAWVVYELEDKRVLILLPIILITLVAIAPDAGEEMGLYLQPTLSPYPAIRFFLMPQFWTLQPDESFLLVSSLFHWALFAPLLYGAVSLWKKSKITRLFLIYSMITIGFYSMVPELQGYRHRMQLTFIIALCQFQALWTFFHAGAPLKDPSTPAGAVS
ncbi:MAG: hypothetical protein J0M12_10125 [Deltaproteobacteria bacterium]|nr:hypothetical protein [Deltaproteobacteria bacterium]